MTNNEPARVPAEQENAGKKEKGFTRLLRALTHNWGWKIGSLALAVCLWGILITQDTSLPREKVIEGVRVTVTNSSALRGNGMVVVDGLDGVSTVKLRVSVPQRNYSSAAASNYVARLDLSQIQHTGEQTLKITASSSNQAQVPVEVRLTGEMPENYYGGAVSRSADAVDISGPASVVEKAARCVVEYDQSALSPERSPNAANLPFYFEDAEGNVRDDRNLTVTLPGPSDAIQRITVRQDV